MTDPHLDDEQLSLLVDGLEVDDRAHLDGGCAVCAGRLDALQRARDAVAAASVPPLAASAIDRLVTTALVAPPHEEQADADVVPLDATRRRSRFRAPPPAWLLGAAAAVIVLLGVAGIVRVTAGRSGGANNMASVKAQDDSSTGGQDTFGAGEAKSAATAAGGGVAVAVADPELVSADLADQDDPAQLALVLGNPVSGDASALSTRQSAAADGAPSPAAESPGSASGSATAVPSAATPADRAQCRPQAEAIGGGRLSTLVSTATLRWKGEPAEVLVFRLAEPSTDGRVTRQALVLSRPGCALLADPRF